MGMRVAVHRLLAVALVLCESGISIAQVPPAYKDSAERLTRYLHWQQGSVVGDIGAGRGELTLAAAKVVGPSGRVYSTELDDKKLSELQELAAKNSNITALKAGVTETNLPPACCDSIFMRLVYHHLTKPAELDASLFQSLKPGGLLAVIDQEPPPGTKPPEGVPENRIGHGVPQKIVIEEVKAAGFDLVKTINDWPDNDYCVLFRKPGN